MTSTCECCGQEVEASEGFQFWTAAGAVVFGLLLADLFAHPRRD